MKKKSTQIGIIAYLLFVATLVTIVSSILLFTMKQPTDNLKTSLVAAEIVSIGATMIVMMMLSLRNKYAKEDKKSVTETIVGESGVKETEQVKEEPTEETPVVTTPSSDNGSKVQISILDIQTAFLKSEERLIKEVKALGKRSNINLVIGSVIALIGWALLVWFIIDINNKEMQGWQMLNAFIPRLTIIIMIEIFSYFFLKLYRESIDRIRYYQNEITNIESKKIAILASVISDKDATCKSIIESLLKVDRNILLRKGETTIELEKLKIENNSSKNLLSNLKDLGLGFIQK